MYNNSNNDRMPRDNRAIAGLFLVILGGLFLLNQMDFFFFPHWLFSWPTLLILIGVLSGLKHNFRNSSSYILIAIGSIFLLGHIIHIAISMLWPLLIIAFGIRIILGHDHRNHNWYRTNPYNDHKTI